MFNPNPFALSTHISSPLLLPFYPPSSSPCFSNSAFLVSNPPIFTIFNPKNTIALSTPPLLYCVAPTLFLLPATLLCSSHPISTPLLCLLLPLVSLPIKPHYRLTMYPLKFTSRISPIPLGRRNGVFGDLFVTIVDRGGRGIDYRRYFDGSPGRLCPQHPP